MRFRDKIGPLHDPILKPAILPDFLAVARKLIEFPFFWPKNNPLV
jgi:hypothetical protein